jgi:hypothetical protein
MGDMPTMPTIREQLHRLAADPKELLAPSTQLVADRDDYLGQGSDALGRRISADTVEVFFSGELTSSLQRAFEAQRSEFIALHDVGGNATLRLLESLASAAGAPLQRLTIRRQGHGVALAVLRFVEVMVADGSAVRVYATAPGAPMPDAQAQGLARTLLACSKLGVLLLGDLPAAGLTAALQPLHDAMLRHHWHNRELLLVPLGAAMPSALQATGLGQGSSVAVHVAPRASAAQQVWGFIAGTWNRLHSLGDGSRALPLAAERALPRPAVPSPLADTQEMPLDPLGPPELQAAPPRAVSAGAAANAMPPSASAPSALSKATPMPTPGATRWQAYAEQCAGLKGAIACCVFDLHSLLPLAFAGQAPTPQRLAQHGVLLLTGIQDATRALGLGIARPEAGITAGAHHLLLRHVPGHPGVAVHLVLQAAHTSITLARMQLERVEPPL